MGYSLYKYFETPSKILPHELVGEVACDSKTEGVLNNKSYNNDFEVQIFKPSLFNLFLKGYCKSFKDYISYLFWLVISYFELTIYYVKDGEKLIHTSLITGKSFKFPFMGENNLHIGPSITREEYRGRGIYPKVLQKIALDFSQKTLFMIIEDSNIASIKGVTKAGFKKIGKICKYKKLFSNIYTLKSDEWKYYNHAVIPNTAPHIPPDLAPLKDSSIWNLDGKYPLFVRWTSDFDCKNKTDWWYIIKDNEYNVNSISSKKRYYIRKGQENFNTSIIDVKNYTNEISNICYDAFQDYPLQYKPNFKPDLFKKSLLDGSYNNYTVFGTFNKTTNELCGFIASFIDNGCIHLDQLKVLRISEKDKVNFALIDSFLSYYNDLLVEKNYYIENNERNLIHKTNFPDFLCKYFGFRKAYCKLNIAYRPILKPFVFILYLFRKTINHLKNKSSLLYKINAVLEMESIARKCRDMK